MMKIHTRKIFQTVLLRTAALLLLMAGTNRVWALYTNVGFANQNRISNNGAGVFTSDNNAGNQYALAIADLSGLNGINTVGVENITFDVNFSLGSRWQIGIGDKRVRGTNANGSSSSSYNTTGLIMQIGDDGGNYYRVKIDGNNQYGTNNSSAYNDASGRTVRVNLIFNRESQTFNYSLTDTENNTIYFQGSGINTTVESVSIIEAYTWANSQSITLSNVTVNYNFFFDKTDETMFIEDIVYNNPFNNAENKTNLAFSVSDASYLRENHAYNNYYPIKPTGTVYTNLTEGDPITVTATADDTEPTRFRLRIKTRNELNPVDMYVSTTNTFDVGSTLGMFTSQSVVLDGMTLYLGYETNHTAVVRSINGDYGVTVIDGNGYTFGNYDQGHEWGTVYKIVTTQAKTLIVSGYFPSNGTAAAQLYDSSHNAIEGKTIANPGDGTLATARFALEAGQTYYLHQSSGWELFALKSLSYRDAYFEQSYAVTAIGTTYTQTVTNMENPVYSIVDKNGEIASTGVTINSSTGEVSNITSGGALKIQASGGGKICYYVLTVAYEATAYPGHLWDFYSVEEGLTTTGDLKVVPNPSTDATIKTGLNGYSWKAEYKNANNNERPEWYLQDAVRGDNAFIVPETAGLVFVNNGRNFFVRNDVDTYSHIGIRGNGGGTSFTIPLLKKGDIVEIMWRHESAGSGSSFTATNLIDLRGKEISEEFEITESAYRRIRTYVGPYSFVVAADGDVTFTLTDYGNNDIQTIRIYNGGYLPTMRKVNLIGNVAAPNTLLLDNQEDGYTYTYCNQLYSTATGPAMYVLKGYVPGRDNIKCVQGSNAADQSNYQIYTDENAYPISQEESDRLYEMRKNLVGFKMYNTQWLRGANYPTYNYGHIDATSGWGKVTIRMNNYTADMKYLIGYTPDYTLTIGSAPHQKYPYTWDFTKIAGQEVTGRSDNVLYGIEAEGSNTMLSGQEPTNWFKNGNGLFTLNTNNNGEIGSQYVPGAILVTTERALSEYAVPEDETALYAKDELDGLGVEGDIVMHTDHLPSDVSSGWNRATVADVRNTLLSFNITDYAVFTQTGGTEDEPIGVWSNPATEQSFGEGTVQIHSNVEIEESSIPSGGIGCKLNDGNTKYIHIRLNSLIQAGDIISVTAYNAYNNRDAGVRLNKSNSKDDVAQSMMLSERLVEETLNYTVANNDGLDGRSDFYIYMNSNTVHVTAVEITRSASAVPNLDWSIYTMSETTLTIPDLNAGGKQDWIYVSASAAPTAVSNAAIVSSGTDGPDANQSPELEDSDAKVYKYKVTAEGNAYLTFAAGTKIYKIGVTHILKGIHPVGGVGWATESRDHSIDHALTGYFTVNDVNAYTVRYDSYDMKNATVALTPVNEDGYVPQETGIVLRLDNGSTESGANLTKANSEESSLYRVPLFYPSYTLGASSTSTTFPDDNMMYPNLTQATHAYENAWPSSGGTYTKFILTNKYWTFDKDHTLSTDELATANEADAAGFYRMHIWKKTADASDKNTMAANTAYLLVPSDNLPAAVWTLQEGYSAARGVNLLGVYNIGPGSETGIDDVLLDSGEVGGLAKRGDGNDVWYTLSGVKLSQAPVRAGLYICNGRKVVVK